MKKIIDSFYIKLINGRNKLINKVISTFKYKKYTFILHDTCESIFFDRYALTEYSTGTSVINGGSINTLKERGIKLMKKYIQKNGLKNLKRE